MKMVCVLITTLLIIHTTTVLGNCEKCGSRICCCEFSDFKEKYPYLLNLILTKISGNYEFAAYLFKLAIDNPELTAELNARAKPDPYYGMKQQVIEIRFRSGYDGEFEW